MGSEGGFPSHLWSNRARRNQSSQTRQLATEAIRVRSGRGGGSHSSSSEGDVVEAQRKPQDAPENMLKMLAVPWINVTFCVVGIVGSLMVYGFLQEKVMTRPYGVEEEKFTYSMFIVLNNRLISCAVAVFALWLKSSPVAPVAPVYKYFGVSLSNVIATFCQYEALKYVSFPLQTLAKCAKMIPVMIWGYFIMKRRYNAKDYLVALLVTGGCTAFLLYGDVGPSHGSKSKSNTTVYGMLLMLGYLGFDGFTSTFQDKLFSGYQMETYNQMLYVTASSTLISTISLLSSGQVGPAIAFVMRHPDCMMNILTLSAASTMGQLFILYTIKEYGALLFATIMTTRQFLSILLSCIVFAHPLTWQQWVGTGVVFSALYYKTLSKKKTPEKPVQETATASTSSAEQEKNPLLPQ